MSFKSCNDLSTVTDWRTKKSNIEIIFVKVLQLHIDCLFLLVLSNVTNQKISLVVPPLDFFKIVDSRDVNLYFAWNCMLYSPSFKRRGDNKYQTSQIGRYVSTRSYPTRVVPTLASHEKAKITSPSALRRIAKTSTGCR